MEGGSGGGSDEVMTFCDIDAERVLGLESVLELGPEEGVVAVPEEVVMLCRLPCLLTRGLGVLGWRSIWSGTSPVDLSWWFDVKPWSL